MAGDQPHARDAGVRAPAPAAPVLKPRLQGTGGWPVGATIVAIAVASYVFIWSLMWGPYYLTGTVITILFYPYFLVAWLFIEITALVGLVYCIVSLVRRAPHKKFTVLALCVAIPFVVFSLGLLWFGGYPVYWNDTPGTSFG